jgi:D-alanyl-D-alanine carboxypeptidase (penicillin-binding protein 5/6)
MKKSRITIVFIMATLFCLLMGVNVNAQDISIESKSAVLIDAGTGEVLFEQNKDEKLPPASITKIMTMLLTMEAIDNGKITMEDKVTISQYASEMGGTQLYIEPGETRTVEELLTGVAVESANDAASALGEYVGGTQETFIKLMNDRAKELGMLNTQFKNANGLPAEGHYTTAYDVALMSKELVKHEKIHQYLTMWMVDVTVGKNNDRVRTLANTNKLLKSYDGLDGIKTGYTTEAKHCLSATAKKGNLRLISVILSADSSQIRFNEAAKLLDYGFANFDGVSIAEKGEEIQEIKIEKGILEKTKAVTENSLSVLMKKGEDSQIEKKVMLDASYKAPIEKGQKLGELIAYLGDKEMGKVNLIASETIEESSFIYMYKKIIIDWLRPVKE